MVSRSALAFLGKQLPEKLPSPTRSAPESLGDEDLTWEDVVLNIYDPITDTKRTQGALSTAKERGVAFDLLRKEYPLRNEYAYSSFRVGGLSNENRDLLKKLSVHTEEG